MDLRMSHFPLCSFLTQFSLLFVFQNMFRHSLLSLPVLVHMPCESVWYLNIHQKCYLTCPLCSYSGSTFLYSGSCSCFTGEYGNVTFVWMLLTCNPSSDRVLFLKKKKRKIFLINPLIIPIILSMEDCSYSWLKI